MNRGVEIAAEVADSVRSTIVEQVANGVTTRMAVLYLLLGGTEFPARGWPSDRDQQLADPGCRVPEPGPGSGPPHPDHRRVRDGHRPVTLITPAPKSSTRTA